MKKFISTLLTLLFLQTCLFAQLKLVKKNGKYGYKNKQGIIKIDCKYDEAKEFDWFDLAEVKRENKNYLIDTTGTEYLFASDTLSLTSETKALDLSRKNLTKIPKIVFNNLQLKILLLHNNQLDSLAQEIGTMKNLIKLDLDYNKLNTLPAEIGKLTNLKELSLTIGSQTDNEKIFNILATLPNFSVLTLNTDTLLPEEIGKLTNLKKLNLSGNGLNVLPAEIKKLKLLTELDLSRNELNTLPAEIKKFKNLIKLDLSENQLEELPAEIGKLINLTELDLDLNKLTVLPQEIGNLKNLTKLDLRSNGLIILPVSLGKLINLKKIDLGFNELNSIPLEIESLDSLIEINLLGNKNFDFISICNVWENSKRKIIISTKYIQNDDNSKLLIKIPKQKSLPPEIEGLNSLVKFDLSSNNLTSLPKEIKNLKKLKEINLINNKKLPFKEICNAFRNSERKIIISTSRKARNNDSSKLLVKISKPKELPKEINNFKSLVKLDLSSNNLTSLPEKIINLENLTEINLRNNKKLELKTICNTFANFPKEIVISTSRKAKNDDNSKLLIKISKLNSLPPEIDKLKNLSAKSWRKLGKYMINVENYTDAGICYKKAVEKEPNNNYNWHMLGYVYGKMNLPDQAIDYYKKAIRTDSSKAYKSWRSLGRLYDDLGENNKTVECFEEALKLKPRTASAWNNMAVAYRTNKEYKKSLEYYKKAIELNPEGKYYHSRAFTYIKLSKFTEAKKDLEKAESMYKNRYIFFYWACYYSLQEDKNKALEYLETAINEGVNDKDWINTEESLNFIRKEKAFENIIEKIK